MTYSFRLFATDGRLQAGGTIEADSDDKACEMASEMLVGSVFPIIKVWRSTKMIYRVGKDDPRPDRKAS